MFVWHHDFLQSMNEHNVIISSKTDRDSGIKPTPPAERSNSSGREKNPLSLPASATVTLLFLTLDLALTLTQREDLAVRLVATAKKRETTKRMSERGRRVEGERQLFI